MDVVLSGRYKLISTLAQGGMGEVWRGLDTMLNRPVAVKLIRLSAAPTAADYDDALQRFQREAQAVAALNHPNIVTAYDFGVDTETNTPYLVMEMIEGRALSAELAERVKAGEGPLPIRRVLAIAADVCAGLFAAHAAGVVHRDLKPANLMTVASTGRMKIVDFGIARGDSLSRITQTGLIVGTVAYIAPEMLSSGEINTSADIYALGCLLFELLTGRSAYDAADPAQFVTAHLHKAPKPLRELLPDAPETLETLLLDMLAKAPEFRPADANEVATRLAAALRDIDVVVEATVEPTRRAMSVPRPRRQPSATFIETGDPATAFAEASPQPVEDPAARQLPRRKSKKAPTARSAPGAELSPSPELATQLELAVGPGLATGPDPVGTPDPVAVADPAFDGEDDSPFIPAQRSSRAGASAVSTVVPSQPRSRRRTVRTSAIAGAVLAVATAVTIWVTSGGGGHPTSSPPVGSTKSPAAATSQAASPNTSASTSVGPSALGSFRTMAPDSACGAPSQLSFNAGGTQLLGAGRSNGGASSAIACLWTTSTGTLTYKVTSRHKILGAQLDPGDGYVTFVTDGSSVPIQVVAVGAANGSIKGSLSNRTHMKSSLEAVAVSSTGHTIAVSYTDSGTIQFYDMADHQWISDVDGGVVGPTGTLAFSPNGSRLAHAEPSGVVVVNASSPAKPLRTWSGPGATAAAFLGDNEIITCSGNRISLYDITSTTRTPKLSATIDGTCVGLAVSPKSHDIAVSTSDHGVVMMTLPPAWT